MIFFLKWWQRNSREDSLLGDSIKHEAPNSPYLAASIRDSDTLQPFWGAVSSGQHLCLSLVVSPGHLPSSIINGQILHISSMHAFKVPCYAGRALRCHSCALSCLEAFIFAFFSELILTCFPCFDIFQGSLRIVYAIWAEHISFIDDFYLPVYKYCSAWQ